MEARTYLETITVLDIPVAVFSDGSVEAAEIGPFPFSRTGYRSILGEDKPLFIQKVAKILEITSRDYAKEFAAVVKRAKKTLTQKAGNDPVSDYIHLTGDLQVLLSYGYFQAWETTAEILHIALKLVKACEKITIPKNYHETCHPNWPEDYLRQRIDNVQVIEPVLQRCLAAKNLYELAATPCIDHLSCTNSVYARLFETTVLPTLSPSAEYYFYCRICAERGVTVAPETTVTTISPSPDPVAAGPTHSPVKTTYVVGWQSAETPDHEPLQLYAIKTKKDFGVTYNPSEATGFKTIEAALGYYRQIGHLHGDPEVNIYNGFLQIFQHGPAGLRQVPKITRQGSLFDAIEPGNWDQPALPKVVK